MLERNSVSPRGSTTCPKNGHLPCFHPEPYYFIAYLAGTFFLGFAHSCYRRALTSQWRGSGSAFWFCGCCCRADAGTGVATGVAEGRQTMRNSDAGCTFWIARLSVSISMAWPVKNYLAPCTLVNSSSRCTLPISLAQRLTKHVMSWFFGTLPARMQ